MQVIREFPEMFPSELQIIDGQVLQMDTTQRLTLYSEDMLTEESVQLEGGNVAVIPQVRKLGHNWAVFYFDKDWVLHIKLFKILADLKVLDS